MTEPTQPIDWEAFNEGMRNAAVAFGEAMNQFTIAVEAACVEAGKTVRQLANATAEVGTRRGDLPQDGNAE